MSGRCVLPGVFSSAPSMVMSSAMPDWAVKMPGICQPLATAPSQPSFWNGRP